MISIRHTTNSTWQSVATGVLLALVIAFGAYLRLVGLDWDENYHLHPDERFLTMVESAMSPVESVNDYFDTMRSTLNPNNVGFGFFVYGNFPMTVVYFLGNALGLAGYSRIYLVGRAVSAIADILSIFFLFLAARRLFDARTGLISAALYAGAALPIQLSHFFTVDAFTNLFVISAFWLVTRMIDRHNWLDIVGFGVLFGLGLASKINIFPLALILMLAFALRIVMQHYVGIPEGSLTPVFDRLRAPVIEAGLGLLAAGIITLLIFRIAQPYAFLPIASDVPVDEEALGGGIAFLSRVSNPLGMRLNPLWLNQMSEVRGQVSGYADIPPNHQWGHRLPILFPWENMVREGLGWAGGLWCTFALFWAIWEILRQHSGSERLILPVTWTVLYFTWLGFGWVTTMRYFAPVYPFFAMLGAWALVTLYNRIAGLLNQRSRSPKHPLLMGTMLVAAVVIVSTNAWGFAVSRIYTRPVTRVEASRWLLDNVPSDITLTVQTSDGIREIQVGLPNNWPLPNPAQPEDSTQPQLMYTQLTPDVPAMGVFDSPVDGTLISIRLNHVLDPSTNSRVRSVEISVHEEASGAVVSQSMLRGRFTRQGDPRGRSYTSEASKGAALSEGARYFVTLKPDSQGNLVLSGATLAVEGDWDDPLPLSIAPYNVWGAQLQGYEIQMAWEDIPEKRDRMQYILDRTDYIVISSNRFYGSMSRNPQRFPLTIAYYRALFSGNLGYDLIADFTSRPTLGPFTFIDDYAEEAWTVYDHPRVLVFHKSSRYDPARTAEILNAVDLDHVVRRIAKDAVGEPVMLIPPELPAANTSLAIQNFLYHFYLDHQIAAVVLWWVLISMIGFATIPFLYWLWPSLPDRGYAVGRIAGLLIVAWLGWLGSSLHLFEWSGSALFGIIAILALLSIGISFRNQGFREWVPQNRDHILFVEILAAILFLFFLLVRLGNPDLWHPYFGGEKPMDMAYFNAVLKSHTFPPYDPWFAGGTINYYYFGFVIVAIPVKMLGIPSSLAYNLIIPTWFALTGIGAFSVIYDLVAEHGKVSTASTGWRTLWKTLTQWLNFSSHESLSSGNNEEDQKLNLTPYHAGLAATAFAIVLGNLDQIRTLLWGLAELGAGRAQWAIEALPDFSMVWKGIALLGQGQILPVGIGEWYWNATRVIPVPLSEAGSPLEIGPITEFPYFTFLYADLHAHMIAMPLTLAVVLWCVALIRQTEGRMGWGKIISVLIFGALLVGSLRPTNTWDLPTYLLMCAGALLMASFLQAGLANALPAIWGGLMGGGLLGVASYLITSPLLVNDSIPNLVWIVAGGAAMFGFASGFGFTLRILNPNDSSGPAVWLALSNGIWQSVLLIGLTVLFYYPFIRSYQLAYTSLVKWEGSNTPLWAYIDILGLFLFVIISWLIFESARLFKSLQAAGYFRRSYLLPLLGVGIGLVLVTAFVSRTYPAASLIIPLSCWAGVLLFANLEIEKQFVLICIIGALYLSLLVEGFVLLGDIGRMNTVFKFYLQIWLLLALSSGAAFYWLWPAIRDAGRVLRFAWIGLFATLILLASLYPLLATRAKTADRWVPETPLTLDGLAFMQYAVRSENGITFPLSPDYHALIWLRENISGTPVILEAHTVEYMWGNRVAMYTGLPSVIGWNWHQRQQRATQSDEVWKRVGDVDAIYSTDDVSHALDLLRTYHVELIIVGDLERAYYSQNGLNKFALMEQKGLLELLYDQENTRVYRVVAP